MIIFGFLLIIVGVAAAVILIVQNTGDVVVSALGQSWTLPALWLVVAGLVAMAVAVMDPPTQIPKGPSRPAPRPGPGGRARSARASAW